MIQTLSDLKTVRFNEQADGVIILDQTLLPGKEAYLTLTTAEEIWDAIYKLKVRGAPAIGVAAAYGIYVCARRIDTAEKSVFVNEFRKIKEYLPVPSDSGESGGGAEPDGAGIGRSSNLVCPGMERAII